MKRIGIAVLALLGLGGLACLAALPLVLPASEPEDPLALVFSAGLLWISAFAVYLSVKGKPWLGGAVLSVLATALATIAIAATGFTSTRGIVLVVAAAAVVLSVQRSILLSGRARAE